MENEEKKLLWLDNPRTWRNIRGGALIVVLLIAPLVYFGIVDNFSIANFLNYDFGALIIFMTFMNLLTVYEVRNRSFEDELDFDKSIVDMEIEIDDNAKEIRPNIAQGIEVLSAYNKNLQQSYNKQKTNIAIDKRETNIDKLNIKIAYAKFVKTKKLYEWLKKRNELKIEKYKEIPKRDRRFKPYRFDRLLTSNDISKYKRVGDSETKSNPRKIPLVGAIIKMPIKGFSMSLGGMFLMLFMVDDPKELAKFYLWFIIIIVFTIVTQYIITRYKTKVQYKKSLTIKIHLQHTVIEGVKESNHIPVDVEEINLEGDDQLSNLNKEDIVKESN